MVGEDQDRARRSPLPDLPDAHAGQRAKDAMIEAGNPPLPAEVEGNRDQLKRQQSQRQDRKRQNDQGKADHGRSLARFREPGNGPMIAADIAIRHVVSQKSGPAQVDDRRDRGSIDPYRGLRIKRD